VSDTTNRLDEPATTRTRSDSPDSASAPDIRPGDRSDERPGWKTSWPLRGPEAVRLLIAFVIVSGTGILVGLVMTDWGAPNAITRLDVRAANWFADNRTSSLNSLAPWAAGTADTFIKIGISSVIVAFLLWKFRRWNEGLYVALPLVFEATCFVTITKIVQRPRPDVERLIESTIASSFPSGHVAAATVYAAVVIVVWRHQRSAVIRALAASIFVVVLAGVIWARLYQGMHFVSDVVAGVVLGVTSLYVSDRILTAAASKRSRQHPAPYGAPVAEGV
jgi:membrane-associated phospholipid phosphatase